MLDPYWVFLSAALGLVGSAGYAYAVRHERARPNPVTWSLWAFAPLIGFFAQLDAGVGLPAVPTLAAGLGPLAVVVAGLCAKHERAHLGRLDSVCAAVAAVALGVWVGLDQAPSAVILAVGADAIAALPTIRKAWQDPSSENLVFYVLVGIGAVITLLTITSWEPAAWAFVVYMLALCITLVSIVLARRHTRSVAAAGSASAQTGP